MVFNKNKRLKPNYLSISAALKCLNLTCVSSSTRTDNSYLKVVAKIGKKWTYMNKGKNRSYQMIHSSLVTAKVQLTRRGMPDTPENIWTQIAVWSLYPKEDKKWLEKDEYTIVSVSELLKVNELEDVPGPETVTVSNILSEGESIVRNSGVQTDVEVTHDAQNTELLEFNEPEKLNSTYNEKDTALSSEIAASNRSLSIIVEPKEHSSSNLDIHATYQDVTETQNRDSLLEPEQILTTLSNEQQDLPVSLTAEEIVLDNSEIDDSISQTTFQAEVRRNLNSSFKDSQECLKEKVISFPVEPVEHLAANSETHTTCQENTDNLLQPEEISSTITTEQQSPSVITTAEESVLENPEIDYIVSQTTFHAEVHHYPYSFFENSHESLNEKVISVPVPVKKPRVVVPDLSNQIEVLETIYENSKNENIKTKPRKASQKRTKKSKAKCKCKFCKV